MGRIGWKGGALHPFGCTFPPSPLRTGRATHRCIRLSNIAFLKRWHGNGDNSCGKYGRAESLFASCRIAPHEPFPFSLVLHSPTVWGDEHITLLLALHIVHSVYPLSLGSPFSFAGCDPSPNWY